MQIGKRIRDLRISQDLTQEELADRSELTKGFISQVENEKTSPSIESLCDILEALGTNPSEFFAEEKNEKIIFVEDDYFETVNEDLGYTLNWIVPNAQKNLMEPVIIELDKDGQTKEYSPYEGDEFGYVLKGEISLTYDGRSCNLKSGEVFYFRANKVHSFKNVSKERALVLWVSSPPNF